MDTLVDVEYEPNPPPRATMMTAPDDGTFVTPRDATDQDLSSENLKEPILLVMAAIDRTTLELKRTNG
jgi:hypothetical protein